MARTESISIQVHPNDEQPQINLMERFHWSLLGSQTIDRVDNSLERRGDTIYAVRTEEKYVKLQFSRDLALPNLGEVKRLEQEYFALPWPDLPSLFPGGVGLWFVLCLFGIGFLAWPLYYFLSYASAKPKAEQAREKTARRRGEILEALSRFS